MTLVDGGACDGVSAQELRLARAVLDGLVAAGPAGAPVDPPQPVPIALGADELVGTLEAARGRLNRLLESVDVLDSGLPAQDRQPADATARRTVSAGG